MNVVVGRSASMVRAVLAASNGPWSTTVPPLKSVAPDHRTETEWYSGEHTRWTSSASNCQRSTSSARSATASDSSSRPDQTPLARPVVPDV